MKSRLILIIVIVCLLFIGSHILLSIQHIDSLDARYQYTQTSIVYEKGIVTTNQQHIDIDDTAQHTILLTHLQHIYASHLSTKTPYASTRPHRTYVFKQNQDLMCQPIHINHITRHGTRYPLKMSVITKLSKILTHAQQWSDKHGIHMPYVDKMITWVDDFNEEIIKQELSHVGRTELYGIGYRLVQQFSSLFDNSNGSIIMESTNRTRTKLSRKAFIDGMHHATGSQLKVHLELPDVPDIDCSKVGGTCPPSHLSLLFYESCPLYTRYKRERKWMLESHRFVDTYFGINSIAHSLLESLFEPHFLLQLWDITNITTSQQYAHHRYKLIRKMFQLCQLQKSIFNRDDEWCSLFWKDEGDGDREQDGIRHGSLLSLMEYNEDLKSSHLKGHGTSLAHNIACPLLTSFLNTIHTIIIQHQQGKQIPKGYFRFAHAETLMPFFAVMGLYNDTIPLSASTYPAASRAWRTSSLTPMAGNMYWVTHVCDDVSGSPSYHISLYHNEHVIPFPIPGCDDHMMCEWSRIYEYYSSTFHADGIGQCKPEDVARVCYDEKSKSRDDTLEPDDGEE